MAPAKTKLKPRVGCVRLWGCDAMWDIEAIRREFPILERVVYLNTGTAGVLPASVAEKLWESIAAFEMNGESPTGWGEAAGRMEEARARLAAFLGADAGEIALTRNATDGVNLVVEGIPWKEGDEILMSNQEHPSMLFPWTYLTQRKPVSLNLFKIGDTPDETLANIRAAMTPRTRLLASSHVSSQTGTRIPAAEVIALCRERDIRVLLDGAQAAGQFPLNLPELGVDYYTSNVHKWLHGPKGTGFLYVARDRLDELLPTWVGAESGGFSEETGLQPADCASRFEYGTRDFGKYGGISALFDWHESVGFENEWAWMRHLTAILKARLTELKGVVLHTPPAWDESSALTTFSIPGADIHRYHTELWENDRLRLRSVGELSATRISTAFFNTEAEIDLLIRKLIPYIPS